MSRTAYYWDPVSLEHDTGEHVESPLRAERLCPRNIRRLVDGFDTPAVERHETVDWICRVHDPDYHNWVKTICDAGGGALDEGDTRVSARSYPAALASVEAALTAADAVMAGRTDNAFSAMRPPGHHALPSRAMGFCLFANVAILARYLQLECGVDRIAVVDWDLHHGNGTQSIFWQDPNVFFASLHQSPLWPGSGAADETGEGPGKGATLNVPIPPGTLEAAYLARFDAEVLPAIRAFRPDFLIISAGFDAHAADPLGALSLTGDGYAKMTRQLKALAADACHGRIISCLEGGYNLEALERSVAAHVRTLLE